MNTLTQKILTTLALTAAVFTSSRATDFNSSYIGATNGLWNVPRNWLPSMVPMNGAGDTYNVTITSRFVGLNVDATISNLTLSGTSGRVTATDRNLTVEGATSLISGGATDAECGTHSTWERGDLLDERQRNSGDSANESGLN
ncbi:MAG: hypothetical protein M3Q89_14590 [Verrucomicrobiota bacterium]|nr:hypothetical protein [Verrucomicrobiota bacterium]